MDYDEGQGWHDGRIVPYGPISFDPGATTLHYGQMMFEGLKAYRNPEGGINLFRPDMNAKRLNHTNERMCIPPMDEELFLAAVKAIVKLLPDFIFLCSCLAYASASVSSASPSSSSNCSP